MSKAWVPMTIKWFNNRVISANMAEENNSHLPTLKPQILKADLFLQLTSNVFGANGHFDSQKILNGHRVHLLVGHHAHVVQAVHIWQRLEISHTQSDDEREMLRPKSILAESLT